MVDVSVVIPHRDRSALLAETIDRVQAALDAEGLTTEVIVVCDGSPPEAWQALCSLADRRPEVTAIRLDRRSWALNARAVGMLRARGHIVATVDDDLDIAPERVVDLVREVQRGAALAAATRAANDGRAAPRRLGSTIIRALSATIPGHPTDVSCGLKAFSASHARTVVDAWPKVRDIRMGMRMYDRASTMVEVPVERSRTATPSNHRPLMLLGNMVDTSLTIITPTRWLDPATVATTALVVHLVPVPGRLRWPRALAEGVLWSVVALSGVDALLARRSPVPGGFDQYRDGEPRRFVRRGGTFVDAGRMDP